MLLNEGEYGNARLLAPHTVRLMTSNALPPDVGYADIARRMGDIGPTPEMAQGFGLGFAVRTAEDTTRYLARSAISIGPGRGVRPSGSIPRRG
jgi:hypothetical protein